MKVTLEGRTWCSNLASGNLRSLRRVIEELRLVHEAFIERESYKTGGGADRLGDHGFWYTERPQVGFLAAAIWRAGGTALEEYRTPKRAGRRVRRGRGDLWFRFNDVQADCEAKRIWLDIGRKPEGLAKRVDMGLGAAARDLLQLASRRGFAICFVTAATRAASTGQWGVQRDRFLRALEQSAKCTAYAWFGYRAEPEPLKDQFGFIYPGLLLAVREVKKR